MAMTFPSKDRGVRRRETSSTAEHAAESAAEPSELREALDSQVTERDMYAALARAAKIGQWLYIHHHDSRHSAAGFPDIIAIRGGELLALECKRTKGKTTPAQETWLAAFREFSAAHGLENYVEAAVVRPGTVHAYLERLASRPGLSAEVAS